MKSATSFAAIMILALTQTALAQTANEASPAVKLTIDMSALSNAVTMQSAVVHLDGAPIDTSAITADGAMNIPVASGKHILKVFVAGHGADQISFETKPETSGKFAITLTPNLIGLTGHIDDYKLEWVNGSANGLAPTSGPIALKFTDKDGGLIPATQVMDARISAHYLDSQSVNVTDLFSITEPGIISVQDKQRFLQFVSNDESESSKKTITLRVRDPLSGIDYEAYTRVILAPVSIKGRIIRGATTPETISLEGVKLNIGGVRVETDADGRFSVAGVPAGNINLSARIYDRGTREDGRKYKFTYAAGESFDLSGPAEVELTVERRKRGAKRGLVTLVSHSPAPDITPQVEPSPVNSKINIKPHVRFKLINLISNPSPFPDGETQQKVEAYCQDAYKRGWNVHGGYCANKIKKNLNHPIDIWAGPEGGASPLGQLHISEGNVWFASQGDQLTAKITPEYHLSDSGYGGFGYAVTLLDFEGGKAAINLPALGDIGGDIGWIDMAELLGKTDSDTGGFDNAELAKSNHIGFSALPSCGSSFAGEPVFVEATDAASFTYRLPTAHDLWSAYESNDEQPPLGEHETITAPWEKAYSAQGRLILVPNPGKEC